MIPLMRATTDTKSRKPGNSPGFRRFRGKIGQFYGLLSPLSDRENLRKFIEINRYEIGFEGF